MLYSSALSACSAQAAARGKKTAAVTEPDPDDPLASQYGDLPMVQSVEVTDKKWTAVSNLTNELENTEVSALLHLFKKNEKRGAGRALAHRVSRIPRAGPCPCSSARRARQGQVCLPGSPPAAGDGAGRHVCG